MTIPHNITGIILKLFPSICTGKETYFRASYWHHEAATLEIEIAKYFQSGAALFMDSPFPRIMIAENSTATMRLTNTRNTDTPNISPPSP
mmetsp:Transcript_55901/g.120308  ORF Transcript_55901/g.120308 Transcript_55901/m.120308 type:complete len:90 (-) Transcript_55901:247-516(-)